MMEPKLVVGPSLVFKLMAGVLVAVGLAGMLFAGGAASLMIGALALFVAWRLLGVFVVVDAGALVVRNIWWTKRFPVGEVDVRARVVDPRGERYFPGEPGGTREIPTASDDYTVKAAKWYEVAHGDDVHSIDALAGRNPPNHERLALKLRHQVLAARGNLDL